MGHWHNLANRMALVAERKRTIMENMEMLVNLVRPEEIAETIEDGNTIVLCEFENRGLKLKWQVSNIGNRLYISVEDGTSTPLNSQRKEWLPKKLELCF